MVSTEISIPKVPSETEFADVHVLAVDDSVIDRRVIEKLLKTSSYKVTTVDSGRRALEILGVSEDLGPASFPQDPSCPSRADLTNPCKQGFQVHLIITDYCMPGMTGYELLKTIKGTSTLKEIPVVVMSSENVPTRITSCLAEGAKEFLLKPVRLADVKRLRDHVRHRTGTTADQPDATGGGSKRKLPVDEVLLQSTERRVRVNNGVATT